MRTHSTASPRAGRVRILRYPGGTARVGRHRGQTHTAHVALSGAVPTDDVIAAALTHAAGAGFHTLLTGPLEAAAAERFRAAGFEDRARLHLLRHELVLIDRPTPGSRRAGRRDLDALVQIDDDAFGDFWRLGPTGIREAAAATPRSRVRLASSGGRPAGYAITGLAGGGGYLQRLAVIETARGRGVGRSLVLDGLRWLRRHGAPRALVNTQEDNAGALALYESVGFRRLPTGLTVLGRALD
jgi:ribosomal protein S18 acetylase RimI-like enzyme